MRTACMALALLAATASAQAAGFRCTVRIVTPKGHELRQLEIDAPGRREAECKADAVIHGPRPRCSVPSATCHPAGDVPPGQRQDTPARAPAPQALPD